MRPKYKPSQGGTASHEIHRRALSWFRAPKSPEDPSYVSQWIREGNVLTSVRNGSVRLADTEFLLSGSNFQQYLVNDPALVTYSTDETDQGEKRAAIGILTSNGTSETPAVFQITEELVGSGNNNSFIVGPIANVNSSNQNLTNKFFVELKFDGERLVERNSTAANILPNGAPDQSTIVWDQATSRWAAKSASFAGVRAWLQMPVNPETGHRNVQRSGNTFTSTVIPEEVEGEWVGFARYEDKFDIDVSGEDYAELASALEGQKVVVTYEASQGDDWATRAVVGTLVGLGDTFDQIPVAITDIYDIDVSGGGIVHFGPCIGNPEIPGGLGTNHSVFLEMDGSNVAESYSTLNEGIPVPAGGTTGQILVKASDDDYDVEWATLGD